jgi:hypothetical protein
MQDARNLGLVTGGTDSERSDTYGLEMAPEARREARHEAETAEVAQLRADFHAEPWNAPRRIAIRQRLAQLSRNLYEDRHETREEYEVDRLRARYMTTDLPEEKERIVGKLAALGAVVFPEGSPQYTEYREALRKALSDPKAWDFLEA